VTSQTVPGNQAMSPRHPRPSESRQATTSSPAPSETGELEPGAAAERLAYSVDEAARLTGLSRDLLYDEMRRGNLLYVKVGRRRIITRQHLQQFLGLRLLSEIMCWIRAVMQDVSAGCPTYYQR
jgi:excisionase family DNA binding protein